MPMRMPYLQSSRLTLLLIALHLITDLEVGPPFEPQATFHAFARFGDIFLHVFERGEKTCWRKELSHMVCGDLVSQLLV